ncbi:hypothetical protein [Chlorobium sp. N1]|uniref:hypothetical protein n=1 Tax=Chlorobium sp. N1 TaxID=2491138 RepID=UPI00103EE8B9|nr:hypothetical protein [Chlorobium sp. N1]TCD48486.1 hypothetical protein E0L29_00940 [Chlorobium sp. N1]
MVWVWRVQERYGLKVLAERIWTREKIEAYRITDSGMEPESLVDKPKPVGMVPVVCHYGRSLVIQYPEKFELRDRQQDLSLLKEDAQLQEIKREI